MALVETEKVKNIRALAAGIYEMPANEQTLSHFQAALAQALRDIADELAILRGATLGIPDGREQEYGTDH